MTSSPSLSKVEITKIKKILEEQLKQLENDSRKDAASQNTVLPDINDQASRESERNFELRIKDRERKLYSKIKEALKKIEDGVYGICESCGEMISFKRLLARPVTSHCIHCKAELEAEEKREEALLMSFGGVIRSSSNRSADDDAHSVTPSN